MIHILGIRHHGVGSSKMVQQMLDKIQPDLLLVEGPPEANDVLKYIGRNGLIPPVAMMMYDDKNSQSSTFYPFAKYSPEWIACSFGNKKNIPVRAMDLPASITLSTNFHVGEKPILKEKDVDEEGNSNYPRPFFTKDAMSYMAEVAGFESGEVWWEHQFETYNTEDPSEHFEAVMQVMKALRDKGLPSSLDAENIYREAFMRQIIREAELELYQNIAVVCGAWHAPALEDLESSFKSDQKLLKALPKPKSKISASWIPWTNERLSLHSGYGAGINSPGWYEHLSSHTENVEIAWLSQVAELFRQEGQDMSSAHVLESYRLAIGLCQLRNKHTVSLNELNESVLTVMCMGDGILLELVKKELIVGNRIGEVPEDIPKVPLQDDFEKTIKSLRLRLSAAPKEYNLDLRNDNDLKRSILFHRLSILEIPWAKPTQRRSKGTFKESWILIWSPEMMISLIDAAYLGNTIDIAADQKINNVCHYETKIAKVVELLSKVLPANLEQSIFDLLAKIDDLSAISSDIQDIMTAMPNLISIKRYGDVRKSDFSILEAITNKLLTKVFINIPMACYGLDDENSNKIFNHISHLQQALKINEDGEKLTEWYSALSAISSKDGIHAIIKGCVSRLLLDAEKYTEEESSIMIHLALSKGNDAQNVASWVEGFLRGSGMILIYDNRLWNLLYEWLDNLDKDRFIDVLPYLRRAFSKFEYGERRQIGAKAKKGLVSEVKVTIQNSDFDQAKTKTVMQTINFLMGK